MLLDAGANLDIEVYDDTRPIIAANRNNITNKIDALPERQRQSM
jgi:hypothetical protein